MSTEGVVRDSLALMELLSKSHLLSTTALEILSYSEPIASDIQETMRTQIDWAAPGSARRVPPESLGHVIDGARAEVQDGFQRLQFQTLMSMWGALEVLVEDLFVARISERPGLLDRGEFQKLRIPFAEFLALDEESRLRRLYQLFLANLSTDNRIGVQRFEYVLKCLDLPGSVDPDVAEAIFEMHQLRNLYAHQAGRADARFCAGRLGGGYQIGKLVFVHEITFRNCCSAAIQFATQVLQRTQSIAC